MLLSSLSFESDMAKLGVGNAVEANTAGYLRSYFTRANACKGCMEIMMLVLSVDTA